MVQVLSALTEGMGINAAARLYGVGKNSIYRWQKRLSGMKQTLLLYALTHQFLRQVIEGDELYTRVRKNVAPDESKGWTIVLMTGHTLYLGDGMWPQRPCSQPWLRFYATQGKPLVGIVLAEIRPVIARDDLTPKIRTLGR